VTRSLRIDDSNRGSAAAPCIGASARPGAQPRIVLAARLTLCLLLAALAGCGDDVGDDGPIGPRPDGGHTDDASTADAGRDDAGARDAGSEDAGEPGPDASEPDAGGEPDAGATDFGGLVPTTLPEEHDFELFGAAGHRFWIEVSAEQVARMNGGGGGGCPGCPAVDPFRQGEAAFDFLGDDIYVPGNPVTFADHVVVQDAQTERVCDYGQVEVALVGESTARQWDFAHIPNVRIDANEFTVGQHIGGFEHIRLNNGLVGSIFREALAHRIYRALDYPALRATWAFLGSNVWGPDIWVPMTLIEVYKRKFCNENAELLGGTCENMWEFAGDVGAEFGGVPENACQVSECDNTRLQDVGDEIAAAPKGAGFKQALSSYIEWDRFHQFQCISWILWTGDDPIHNSNNNLIIERDDGKLIWAPYSVDISAGQDWYTSVPLVGSNTLARGCQADPECWADTLTTCEGLIAKFDALDPENLVDEAVESLTDLEMMRDGDEQRAEALREWYVERQLQLTSELERYRYLPDEFGACPEGYEACVPQGGSMDCNEYTPCICLPVGECLGGGGGEDDGGVIEPPPWIEW
jgi:hypothetical protein